MNPVMSWDNVPVILTTEEAADLLRVSENTIKGLIADGELPGAKVGRQWRISRDAVREYIEGGAVSASDIYDLVFDGVPHASYKDGDVYFTAACNGDTLNIRAVKNSKTEPIYYLSYPADVVADDDVYAIFSLWGGEVWQVLIQKDNSSMFATYLLTLDLDDMTVKPE